MVHISIMALPGGYVYYFSVFTFIMFPFMRVPVFTPQQPLRLVGDPIFHPTKLPFAGAR